MKKLVIVTAAALLAGAGASFAQTTTTDTHVRATTGAAINDSATISTPRAIRPHARVRTKQGTNSVLPGKDPLNSKAYIQDH